ncbi:MAG TPA: DNA topoisomerase IB [Azospirillaceae bacterium]|nr:DNA topoisomerase IB [Azospirillaceae bacterium]
MPEPSPTATEEAGLVYVSDDESGIRRRRAGKGFYYVWPDGRRVTEAGVLERIRRLAIPPAYTDVWICPDPQGHIQATGRDDRGRKQYRYHPRWRDVRDMAKYGRLIEFGHRLPAIRERLSQDMAGRGLFREKVLATVVHLLETTLIRVGNESYTRQNQSFGLTTLRDEHVDVASDALRFEFKGKSGKAWRLKLRDRRIARIVKSCQDLPGQHLFQYLDEEGNRRGVTSADVNAYLRDITGIDITAKDFRTWAGTVMAARELRKAEPAANKTALKRTVKACIETVAERLGNTVTVCRQCYVHPAVIEAYTDGTLHRELPEEPDETSVLAFLEACAAKPDDTQTVKRDKSPRPAVSV